MVNRFTISGQPKPLQGRQLHLELLEDRRLLAIIVDTPLDEINGAGVGAGTSLREAIMVANATPGPDEIIFDPAVFATPQTISLLHGEMVIEDETTIVGPGRDLLTIDAQQASRIFNVTQLAGAVSLSGITLANGLITGDNPDNGATTHSGGAIRSITTGLLSLNEMTISSNTVSGKFADGGGILAIGPLAITNSAISNNIVAGNGGGGGGIKALSTLTLATSEVSGNRLTGAYGYDYQYGHGQSGDPYGGFSEGGGAINAEGAITIQASLIDSNFTYGIRQDGGAIFSRSKVTLIDSTLSSNATFGRGSDGGAIYTTDDYGGVSDDGADIVIISSMISGNRTEGDFANGGALYSEDSDYGGVIPGSSYGVDIQNSYFLGNSTLGMNSSGGAMYVRNTLRIADSTISQNNTSGIEHFGRGGSGIDLIGPAFGPRAKVEILRSTINENVNASARAGGLHLTNAEVVIEDSLISGNQSLAGGGLYLNSATSEIRRSSIVNNSSVKGGGIYSRNSYLSIKDSTISGNTTTAKGAGIFAYAYFYGLVALQQTTISGNTADGDGGGIYSGEYVRLNVFSSTIAHNAAGGQGGGLTSHPNLFSYLQMGNSIVAGNSATSKPDISSDVPWFINFSLIGNTSGSGITTSSGIGNVLNLDPLLGPLADNGGPTWTHALLSESPAINAGNPGFTSPPDYDQRGEGFDRVVNGRIDMGAFEVQPPPPPEPSGDFDGDGDVDGRDFLLWQRGFGTPAPNATAFDGDADGDLDVDGDDLDVWQEQYGVGGLSALRAGASSPPGAEIYDLEFMISDWVDRETASEVEAVFESSYIAEVDRAIEELAVATPTGVRSFGEMVARRSVLRSDRVALLSW